MKMMRPAYTQYKDGLLYTLLYEIVQTDFL